MKTIDDLNFVNRDEQLLSLLQWLEDASQHPAVIVVRADRGIGKSSLTDRLIGETSVAGRLSCTVGVNDLAVQSRCKIPR